ncbi:MAG: HIT family protein [Mobilitalea sp.]
MVISVSCLVCERIEMIKDGTNPYFVIELETGYVVLGDHQHFKGYTLFLCKEHVSELHFLPSQFRLKYLEEMSLVAEAVYRVFKPEKLNYEILGNGDSHVHWHLFPRVDGDTPEKGPVWWLPYAKMCSESNIPSPDELKIMICSLKDEIIRLICEKEL